MKDEVGASTVLSLRLSSVRSRKSTVLGVPRNSPSFSTGIALRAPRSAAFLLSNSSICFLLSISASVSSEISSVTVFFAGRGVSSSRLFDEGLDASSSDIIMPKGSKSPVNMESALSSAETAIAGVTMGASSSSGSSLTGALPILLSGSS